MQGEVITGDNFKLLTSPAKQLGKKTRFFTVDRYTGLFPNFDTLTLRYPPQIGCITNVIPSKMSAITLLCTSKKLVIAPEKNIRVITNMKKKIHLKKPKKFKISAKKKSTIKYFRGITYFSKKFHQEIPKLSKMSE